MRVVCAFLILISLVHSSEKNAVLILARGGSKGIYLKNLQKVGGLSMIARIIHTAKVAGFHDITVSTDHPLIALESLKNDAAVFHRSHVTATDWAPSIWGASEFLAHRPEVTILILLQVTSPLLQAKHLRNAVEKIKYPLPFDCIFSVSRSYKLHWKLSRNKLSPINFNIHSRPRRQDWKGELLETGAFYITRRYLIEEGYFQNENCTFIEISPLESLEVDSYQDIVLANILLSYNLI